MARRRLRAAQTGERHRLAANWLRRIHGPGERHAGQLARLNGEPVTAPLRVRAGDRLRLGEPGVELQLVALEEGPPR